MRWIIRAVSSLVVLIVLLVIMVVLMPKDGVLELAAQKFEAATGRKLEIAPGAKVAIWPVLGVSAGPVRLANADWSDTPDMLEAERISIGLHFLSLLDGVLKITEIEVDQPKILLERAQDGRVNWAITPPKPDAPAAGADSGGAQSQAGSANAGFTLGNLQIRNGTVRFTDHAAGTDVELTSVALASAVPDFAGPVSIAGSAVLRGQETGFDAKTDHFSDLLAGRMAGLDITTRAGTSTISFAGRAGTAPLMAEGKISAGLDDRAALSALAGQPFPDLPQGLGAKHLALSGDLTLSKDGTAHLRAAEIEADDHRIAAEIDWLKGAARPRIVARLTTESISFAPATGGRSGGASGGASGTAAGTAGWSEEKIDVSALGRIDAEIMLSAKQMRAGNLTLGPVQTRIVLDNARAVVQIPQAEAWGGIITGQMVINGRSGLSASADLTIAGLDMQALLAEAAGTARLTGTGDLRVKLLGAGDSQAALMRSLSGEAALSLGRGEIIGLDIAGMLRTMDPGYVGDGRKTIFDQFTLTAVIDKGVMTSNDLVANSALFTATGAGQADLGARTLSYRLMPRLLPKDDGTGGVEVPVLIAGPWASPKVRLDLEWLAKERANAEIARAEARARQRFEELSRDQLGVQPQEGEGIEDAVKRRAREAVEAETGRILDRLLNGD